MFLIILIIVVICTLVYIAIQIIIKKWKYCIRMHRLSLKKLSNTKENSTKHSTDRVSDADEIDLTSDDSIPVINYSLPSFSDDSDTPVTNVVKKEASVVEEHNDKENVFEASTDSMDSFISEDSPSPPRVSLESQKKKIKRLDLLRSDNNKSGTSLSSEPPLKTQMFAWKKGEEKDLPRYANEKKYKRKVLYKSKPRKKNIEEEATLSESLKTDECLQTPPLVSLQHTLTIAGTKVTMPVKPYPSQIAVMNKVIKGCTNEEHCLVESPTGSGKTLALLCGSLSWQDKYIAQIQMEKEKRMSGEMQLDPRSYGGEFPGSSHDQDDFIIDKEGLSDYYWNEKEDKTADKKDNLEVSKIYYATRTHKQIAQVVRELGRTAYTHKKMTILSSREHTCIQETNKNKTELCHELHDLSKTSSCPYDNAKNYLSNFEVLGSHGLSTPWDIEDLVRVGKNEGVCPYFSARSLVAAADIIFCPYNYIIDPQIRESMQISLKNHVIILDEAHNIEDICRNVASGDIRADNLRIVIEDVDVYELEEKYNAIIQYLLGLEKFLQLVALPNASENNNDLTSSYWTGPELMELFDLNDIGRVKYQNFVSNFNIAIQKLKESRESREFGESRKKNPEETISRNSIIILEQLIFVMTLLMKNVNDYRGFVVESTVKDAKQVPHDRRINSKKSTFTRVRSLKLLCMKPAVIFSSLSYHARSVILASGTLAPVGSFESELGTSFPFPLIANHVISKDQVCVRCVPRGPTGIALKANYENMYNLIFQDELGKSLVNVCRIVPHGILCFFSSYQMMNRQIDRWKATKCWEQLKYVKRIFTEPRNSTDLIPIMNEYRKTIQETTSMSNGKISGALLFAVYRGKVAEGIDFSDNEARCVFAVGIPYLVRKDPVVDMKCKYNDKNKSKGLLNSSEWYTIQAFRALNQALGRCIRHVNDWGIILLVDERFQYQSNINYLPKWIKSMWNSSTDYNLNNQLKVFIDTQIKKEKKL